MGNYRNIKLINILFSDSEEFDLYKNKKYYSILVIIFLYLVIILAFIIIYYSNYIINIYQYPIKILIFIVIGYCQYSIGNGMHEAVHRNLPIRSDLYSAILCAYPIGLSMGYRDTHLKHHRHVGTIHDPDYEYYNCFPRSRLQLIGRLAKYASGLPAILQFFQIHSEAKKESKSEFIPLLLVQLTIFSIIYYNFHSIYYYLIYWILPVATVGKLLSSTRLMCEHGSPSGWVIRTITGPRYKTWLLGAFDFNYHAEHHLIPSIPFANLKKLHRLKIKKGGESSISKVDLSNNIIYYDGGYLKLIKEFFIALPWREQKREI